MYLSTYTYDNGPQKNHSQKKKKKSRHEKSPIEVFVRGVQVSPNSLDYSIDG